MRCYKCNSVLSDSDYCIKCGADVSVYKVVVKASNSYYNIGLEKAQVRDLTGAVAALRTSLKINKKNIKARNLLGLVYFEMGEAAVAIKEWVISLNLKPDKNAAVAYIRKVKSNPNKLEAINQAAKKYNFSLDKLQKDGEDVALIQLKKVVALNPKFVRAYLLLALIYMKKGEDDKAARTLAKVLKIDRNNTKALRYLDEINQIGIAKASQKVEQSSRNKKRNSETLSGHDVILPPNSYKEPSNGILTVIQILLGVVIGVALVWFLVVPAKLQTAQSENNELIKTYSEQLSSYSITITDLEKQVADLQGKLTQAEEELSDLTSDNGSNAMYAKLISAVSSYLEEDYETAGLLLVEIDVTQLPTDTAKNLYTVMEETCNNGARSYYLAGVNAYNKEDFVSAINYLTTSYQFDNTTVETPYYLAMAYLRLSNREAAQPYIDIVNQNFGTTTYATQLSQYLSTHE